MVTRFRKFEILLLLFVGVWFDQHAAAQTLYTTATIAVGGIESSSNGVPDSGPITVDFNGFVETIDYGQFSTSAALASGLAAMFTRDYVALGLYAKAGARHNRDPSVITFQLATGAPFAPVNIVGSTSSFILTPSGFATSSATVADRGVATLTLNGTPIAISNYGEGSNGQTIAADLALNAKSDLVTVTSAGPDLVLEAKPNAGSFNYSYSVSFSTSLSFSSMPGSGQLTSGSTLSPVQVYGYNELYYLNGNVSGIADSVMGMWAYGYDGLNRLASAQASAPGGGSYAGQSMCWSYDSFGNRLTQSLSTTPCSNSPPAMFAASYASNNRISAISTPALSVSYDIAGNMTGDGINHYTFDAEGRVCAVSGSAGMYGYQYDGNGNRIGKGTVTNWQSCDITANGYDPISDFVMDQGGGQMTEVAVGGGTQNWLHTNVTADGVLIATYDPAGLHFHLSDALGSRRVQTDPNGLPEQTCQSLPYGDQLYCTGSLNSPTEQHFTGKERDAESGLDYFGARYYGSSMGRFMSPDSGDGGDSDPSDPQSWNLYAYVQNNPLTNVDPDGHDCVVQSRIDDKSESVSVSSGNCSGVKTGSGQSATYVPGTVTGISANGSGSIDIGYNSYDGQSSGVTNTRSAPGFDHPGIDGPANAAIFGQIGNNGMGAIKAFVIGSAVGGALGAGGLAVAGYASASTIPSIMAPLLPAVPSAIEKLQKVGVSLQQANQIINNPAVQHVVDNLHGGNINSYQTINGQIIRITTDPSSQRIISAGIVQARNITAGMSSGRFTAP